MIPSTQEDVSTVISVMPIKLEEDKPLTPSHYFIPACMDIENSCECLIVKRGSFRVYIDENRPALIIPEPSDTVAGAICRDYKVSVTQFVSGFAEPGLFWARGGYSKEEVLKAVELQRELQSTRKLQTEWFKNLVKAADDDWAVYKMRKVISDLQRIACKALALERDWDIDLEVTKAVRPIQCKFCRAEVHPDAIICMHCRGILDLSRFKTEFKGISEAT